MFVLDQETPERQMLFICAPDDPLLLELQRGAHPEPWRISTAATTEQALHLFQTRSFDAVVAPADGPSLDGVKLLDEVMRSKPCTLRVLRSQYKRRETTLGCVGKAHHHLLEPCHPPALFQLLRRAEALQAWLPNETVQEVITHLQRLPSPPAIYFAVVEELESPLASVEKVGELVARDPALSAKLIHLANSAVFGLQLEVASPKEAVAYLGLETTRDLVLMAHSFAFFDQVIPSRFSIEHLQAHSLNTAHIARRIAEAEGQETQQADQAFAAGLLHDIGKLVLAANLPEMFSQALAMAAEQRRSLWETESQIFGASHAEIGAVLLGHWGLPMPVLQAVAGHHCPELGGHFPGFSTVTAVHVADVLDHESGSGNLTTAELDLSYLQCLEREGRLESWRQCCQPEPQAA